MTYCAWCGERVTGTPYCGNCGAPTGGDATTRPDEGNGRGPATGLLVAGVVFLIVLVGAGAWALWPQDDSNTLADGIAGAPVTPTPVAATTSPPPTSEPTASPSPSPSPTPSPTPTPSPSPTPSPTPVVRDWVDTFSDVRSGVVRLDVDACDGSSGSGSGFFVSDDLVVTAAHVVADTVDIAVGSQGREVGGRVIGFDQAHDLALVQLDGGLDGHVFDLTVRPLDIAEEVGAAGYPVGGELSLTRGSVSGVDLALTGDFGEVAGVVRTDAAVNPGNSGGPLLLQDGTVAGVVLAKYVATDVEGIGYALTAEIAAPKIRAWSQAGQTVDLECPPPPDLPPEVDDDFVPDGSFGFPEVPSWIAIVESLEITEYGYDEAFDRSLDYDDDLGVITGVLLSDDYSSLNPGYWVIYVGTFDDEDDAAAFCRANRDATEVCYQRFLDY